MSDYNIKSVVLKKGMNRNVPSTLLHDSKSYNAINNPPQVKPIGYKDGHYYVYYQMEKVQKVVVLSGPNLSQAHTIKLAPVISWSGDNGYISGFIANDGVVIISGKAAYKFNKDTTEEVKNLSVGNSINVAMIPNQNKTRIVHNSILGNDA